jgi:hypothetical protein
MPGAAQQACRLAGTARSSVCFLVMPGQKREARVRACKSAKRVFAPGVPGIPVLWSTQASEDVDGRDEARP